MRRFVILDRKHQKIGEGMESYPGGTCFQVHQVTHRDGSTGDSVRSWTNVQEIVDSLPGGQQVRFLDWHTTDEAFKLVDPGE